MKAIKLLAARAVSPQANRQAAVKARVGGGSLPVLMGKGHGNWALP
jgi:hypothetical protein